MTDYARRLAFAHHTEGPDDLNRYIAETSGDVKIKVKKEFCKNRVDDHE